VESVAISSDKRRNLSELVDLEILSGDTFCRLSVDDLELDIVCLGYCFDGEGPRVVLRDRLVLESESTENAMCSGSEIPCWCRAFRRGP
jgi:hypothetical protein